jgi:hypothetical protein
VSSWISATALSQEEVSLPPEYLSHSWIMIVIHLPLLSSMIKYNSTLLVDDLTDFTLPHDDIYFRVETPINESSQLDASKCNVKRVTHSGIIQLSIHFSSSTSYLLSYITQIHLRLDNSEQDLRTYSNPYPSRSGNIPLRNQEKGEINHDGKIFLKLMMAAGPNACSISKQSPSRDLGPTGTR